MMSPGALLKGIVQRWLGTPTPDGPEAEGYTRLGKYREVKTDGIWATDHSQASEGSLFIATTLPAAIALQLGILAAFDATKGGIVIVNTDQPGGKSILLKKLKLCQSVAPTSGVDLRYAVAIDPKDRTPTTIASGTGGTGPGTPATATAYKVPVVNANTGCPVQSIAAVYFPLSIAAGLAPAIPAAGDRVRYTVGNGYVKNSIPVVKDQYTIQFGGADQGGTFQAAAALGKIVEHASPVEIFPGHSCVIHLWSASNITAGNAWDDVLLEMVER